MISRTIWGVIMEYDDAVNVQVKEEDAGKRLDAFLSDKYTELSRSAIQKAIKDGTVLHNGKPAKNNKKVKTGDILGGSITVERGLTTAKPVKIPLDIVYEDNDVVVINKPRGMVVHPAPGHERDTLVNALLYHEHGNVSDINGLLRPGIVHRIDRDTSGLLVCAKNNSAHMKLAVQLKKHTVTRKYVALCYNSFKEESGTVDEPLARGKVERKKVVVDRVSGRRAVTHYKVLENIGNFAYVECVLETGRTHQIRVHMKHIGHPLVGDPVYSNAKAPFDTNGQMLHAGLLGFAHPSGARYMEFYTRPPEDFRKALETLRRIQ